MKRFQALTASLLFASALTAQPSQALEVISHTGDEAGFVVSSYLVEGEREAILIDAQFTRQQAEALAQKVRHSGRQLKTIFITHAHPDHYFGLEILRREFPSARVVAEPEVVKEIQSTAAAKIAQWKPMYGDKITDRVVAPEPISAHDLEIDGRTALELVKLAPGEAEHDSALYSAELHAVFTGDAAFNRVHLWLAENRPEGWLANLDTLAALPVSTIYPGHGEPAGREILEADRQYIRKFVEATQTPATREEALGKIERSYPTYRLPVIARLSVEARIH